MVLQFVHKRATVPFRVVLALKSFEPHVWHLMSSVSSLPGSDNMRLGITAAALDTTAFATIEYDEVG